MTQTQKKKLFTTQNIATIGVLSALATGLFFLEIPVVPHVYNLDFSNVPVMLGAFAMGPVPGLIILLIKDVIHLLIKGLSTTVGVGNLADFITCAAYMLPAAVMYQKRRTVKTAEVGMAIGMLLVTVLSVFLNKWFLFPVYQSVIPGMTLEKIVGMMKAVFPFADTEWKVLLLVTAPFNLLKGFLVMAITYLLYKPLSPVLKGHFGRHR